MKAVLVGGPFDGPYELQGELVPEEIELPSPGKPVSHCYRFVFEGPQGKPVFEYVGET